MEAEQQTAGVGHNKPPLADIEQLKRDRAGILNRLEELTESCKSAPGTITTEENAKNASDLLKSCQKALAAAQEARKVEQQPWENALAATRAVFMVPITALIEARKPLKEAHSQYLQAKKDAERRKREEEAAKAKAEAEELARKAAEEERKRLEAEAAKREAEERARQAQLDREKALAEKREAEAEAERLRKEADEREAEAAQERARKAEEEAERKRQERVRLNKEAELAKTDAREAERGQKENFDQAVRAEQRGDKHEIAASKGKLERVRSDRGAVSSLVKRKVAEITVWEKLPKGILWPHINRDAIVTAVNKAVAAGLTEKDLPGVRIIEVEEERTV